MTTLNDSLREFIERNNSGAVHQFTPQNFYRSGESVSFRDAAAIAAMSSLLQLQFGKISKEEIAAASFKIADAMIAARELTPNK